MLVNHPLDQRDMGRHFTKPSDRSQQRGGRTFCFLLVQARGGVGGGGLELG